MSTAERRIHTIVSKPGPAERALLDDLAPHYAVVPRIAGGVLLRTIASRAVQESSAAEGATKRGPILLVHGRGHAASLWARWLEAWAGRRDVVAVDLPGFGHSASAPLGARPRPEEGLDFFVGPIAALAAELAPSAIVGHSLGGLVALELALSARTRPEKLVLVDAMGLGPVVLPAARLYLRAGPERLARLGLGRLGPSASAKDRLGEVRSELSRVRGGRPDAKRAFDAMLPLFGEPLHRRERLGEFDVETLLLWGERDEAFPLTTALDAMTRIRRAKLVALPAGHSPHLELAPRCIAEVDRFLDEALSEEPSSDAPHRIA